MFYSYNFSGKQNDPQNYYYEVQGFSKEELQKIEKGVNDIQYFQATTLGNNGTEVSKEIRSSQIKWIDQNMDWHWLYQKLAQKIVDANEQLWHFNINHMEECIQYTEYYATEGGHYDWHQDIGPGTASKRKISATIQLSEADEYEGGDLELWQGGKNVITAHRGAGSVFIFPSYMMHRVTPVTKGVRKSFVLWIGGSHYS